MIMKKNEIKKILKSLKGLPQWGIDKIMAEICDEAYRGGCAFEMAIVYGLENGLMDIQDVVFLVNARKQYKY